MSDVDWWLREDLQSRIRDYLARRHRGSSRLAALPGSLFLLAKNLGSPRRRQSGTRQPSWSSLTESMPWLVVLFPYDRSTSLQGLPAPCLSVTHYISFPNLLQCACTKPTPPSEKFSDPGLWCISAVALMACPWHSCVSSALKTSLHTFPKHLRGSDDLSALSTPTKQHIRLQGTAFDCED